MDILYGPYLGIEKQPQINLKQPQMKRKLQWKATNFTEIIAIKLKDQAGAVQTIYFGIQNI